MLQSPKVVMMWMKPQINSKTWVLKKTLFLFKHFSTTTAMMIYIHVNLNSKHPSNKNSLYYVGFKKSKCYYAEIHFNIQTFKWFEIFQWCLKHFLNLVKHSNAYYIIHLVCSLQFWYHFYV